MIVKSKEGNEYNVPIEEYMVDNISDLVNLPKDAPFGSVAMCLENKQVYFMNSKGEWV